MRASYGLEIVDVSGREQGQFIANMLTTASEPGSISEAVASDIPYLTTVADFLEQHGDYKSPEQEKWFSGSQKDNIGKKLRILANGLIKLVTTRIQTSGISLRASASPSASVMAV